MEKIALFLFPVLLYLAGCEKNEPAIFTRCGNVDAQSVVVSETQFENAPNDALHIYETEIQGDCLWIKFGSSGCSGDSWIIKLVASEKEYFSLPPQRDVRLSLKNDELCEAYFVKEMSFDVKELRSSGHKVQINIVNADTSVIYQY